ncbi:M48 family metallopeptidase [Massilia sp. S19_KUP03_FR1]|uniref:M48 family metallopeptidase n=1 Tax=Massilia sp. S19_KUP03_FR1 TaxID=3025503 RepID=UPI002FCDD00F
MHLPSLRLALGVCAAAVLAACQTPAIQPADNVTVPIVQGKPRDAAASLTPEMAANAQLLTKMAALQDRLYRVAAPLLINNAELCKSQARNLLGFTAKNRYSYPGEFNDAAHEAFGMGERLQVTGVLAGSGAAKAGLRVGDGLVAAAGKTLPTGQNALASAGAVFGPIIASKSSLPLSIDRNGDLRDLNVPVTRACAFAIELGNADSINAYADGSRIMVTRGLIAFTRNDQELAYIVAKTMAHNMLGHAAMQRNAGTIGSIIDSLVSVRPDTSMLIGSGGIKAMPAELDVAADRLALYLLVRAGYEVADAATFWKRLHGTYPPTVLNGYVANHPATAARVAAIDKAEDEIKGKRTAKKPLLP